MLKHITRFIKVRAHRGEPLNEAADALTAAAADLDPGRPVAMDLDPEAVHFMYREAWVEWDAKVERTLSREQPSFASTVRCARSVGERAQLPRPPRSH